MNKTKKLIHKKKSDSNKSLLDLYSSKENLKNESKDSDNCEEKELYINNDSLNFSTNSPQEEIMEFEISPIETISIKKFRNLLGILGIKANNFIIERLYQTLIRVSSKKYEHISSNLTEKNFLKFLNILNNSKKHKEIFYTFFDISNKGFVTKKDFVNICQNMCQTISEFTHKNANIYNERIINFFDNISQLEEKNNSQKTISKNIFMDLIEKNKINFFDIMNYDKIPVSNNNKTDINQEMLFSIKTLINKIKQKENIETNLTIATDNYLDNIELMNEDYKQQIDNNSINLSNISSCLDNNNNNINKKTNLGNQINNIKFDNLPNNNNMNKSFATSTIHKNDNISINTYNTVNTNKSSILFFPKIISDTRIKSPQELNDNDDEIEEITSSNESNSVKEDLNQDFINEEKNDNVNEMDNTNIKNIENIKKNKIKLAKNFLAKENLIKNQKKNFYFLKPFRPKGENKLLLDELKKNNIEINDTLILLKKNNFLEYLTSLENNCNQIKLNTTNEITTENIDKENVSNILILNKPLKEKEYFEKEINFEKNLNNFNFELLLAITLGIEKCISSLGDFNLQDKTLIYNLINQENNSNFKTTRKKRNSIFPAKLEKKFDNNNKNSCFDELISNYPFKKNKFIFEQTNIFNYTFYSIDRNKKNNLNLIKAEITEYAPEIFCNIRYNIGEITNKNFLKSFNIENLISDIFLGNIYNLSELLTINPENNIEFIMFSPDTKYIIKCLSQNEFDVFKKILPNYYDYLMSCIYKNSQKNFSDNRKSVLSSTLCSSALKLINNSNIETKMTFLEIIYGLYSFKFDEKKIFFVIKKNIFYSYNNLSITKRYDLKGCSVDRKAKSKFPFVLKDLDFIESSQKINISSRISSSIIDIIENDTLFLSKNNIINYSFYLGISELPENFENDENDEGILSSDKMCMYYFGINDIFKEYGKGKVVEHIFKKIAKGDGISAVPPEDYKNRFDGFIKSCFK